MSVAWTAAARAAVHPHQRVPAGVTWPDPARAERLHSRLRALAGDQPTRWARQARAGDAEARDRVRTVAAAFASGAALSPEDEAVRALLLGAAAWAPGDENTALLVGWWAATGGPVHALACVAHTLAWQRDHTRVSRRSAWGFDPDALGLWHALRRLSVTLDDGDAAAVAAAAVHLTEAGSHLGPGHLLLRCALGYAVPWALEVVRPAGRILLSSLATWEAQPVLHGAALHGWCLLASLDEPDLALQVATHVAAYPEAQTEEFAPTLLDRLGDDAVPVIERLFDGAGRAASRRHLAATLALLETQPAARWMARHLGHPQAAGAAVAWLRAHPTLAVPALAGAASGRRAEPAASALLAQLVQQHGVPVGLRLTPSARALLARAMPAEPAPAAATADDAALPAVWARLRIATRKLPAFVADALPPVRLRTGERLSPAAVSAFLRSVAETAPELVAGDIADVRAALDPADAAQLGRSLVDAWLGAGAPPREGWVVLAYGALAPGGALHLARLIDGWAREARVRRAVLGLDGLAAMGSDDAVFALLRLSVKAPAPSVAERARELLDEIAQHRGLDPDALEDAVMPSLGLDHAARLALDYGGRTFTAGFDERGKAVVADGGGRVLARLPPSGRQDDAVAAQRAQDRWKDVRAAGEFQLSRTSTRLEAAMCSRRGWTAEAFWRLVRHPLVSLLAKRVVWGVGDITFRVAEDWTLADEDDRERPLPEGLVRVPHPLEVPDATRALWSALLADYELVPPFPQMQRPVYRPTEKEARGAEILRVDGRPTTLAKLYGLRHRGWEGMADETGTVLVRALPDDMMATLDVGDGRLGRVRVRGSGRVTLGSLDPIVFSELVRDVEWAALGNSADDGGER